MKNWKKLLIALFTAALFLTLTACSSTPSNPNIKETVVAEQNGVRITLVSVSYTNSIFGPEFKFRIENTTDENLTVQVRNTSVNGYTVSPIMSTEVGAGEKTYGTLTIFNTDLKDCGIKTIETLRTKFHIFYTDTFVNYFDTELITMNLK